jgi:hypothetical protein
MPGTGKGVEYDNFEEGREQGSEIDACPPQKCEERRRFRPSTSATQITEENWPQING